MSSRALRKAQREREAQERLEKLQQGVEEDDVDDRSSQPVKASAFAMLGEEDDEGDEDDGGGAPLEQEDEDSSAPVSSSAAPQKSSKKKKKKKKAKAKTNGAAAVSEPEVDEMDEIDRALKQLSASKSDAKGTTSAGVNAKVDESSRLLAIDTSHLHAQNEMRRLFGRAALEQQDDDDAPAQQAAGGNRRQQRRVQQVGLAQALRGQQGVGGRAGGLAVIALRRNVFIQGKEEWPIATGGGLGMEVEEKCADGTVLYRYVHNRVYQDVQSQFEMCVESMDPNRLVMLLRHNPYHISTLLQVSEIAKQDRDHATSGDLLERALFSFGRAVHSTFVKNLAEGKARLSFARPENREFWLASWRYMQNLSMRGTWRTVYEWAKLLLSLSPDEDPYALWLVLDQYAMRARQELDFLNISRNPTFKAVHGDTAHVQLSQAFAENRAGNKGKGKQALFTTIGRFPWMTARLMRELGIDAPPAVWGKGPRTEREKLEAELYATRAKDLWNTPEATALLAEVAAAVPAELPTAEPDTRAITVNEARHVLLSDTPALIALLPRTFTTRMTSSSDPLPPDNDKPSYTTTRSTSSNFTPSTTLGSPAESLRELQGLHNWFAQLFPWFRNGGANGQAAGVVGGEEGHGRPTEEEVERRMRDAGVSEEVVMERTQRMVELQQVLMGMERGEEGDGGGAHEVMETETRIENASDEG